MDVDLSNLCDAGYVYNSYRGTKSFYRIRKQNGRIEISLGLRFTFVGNPALRADVNGQLNQAIECVKRYFANYGVTLLLFHAPARDSRAPVVKYQYGPGRSSSKNLVLNHFPPYNCSMLAHEIAHHFGVPDRYPHPDCPDRSGLAPINNLMHGGGIYSVDRLYLMPSDFRRILAPLCGAAQ